MLKETMKSGLCVKMYRFILGWDSNKPPGFFSFFAHGGGGLLEGGLIRRGGLLNYFAQF